MTQKRVSGAKRRSLILDAARRVFTRDGYNGAKTQDIAREAQVSEALVYRHFPSKLALYRAVLRLAFREQDANWQALAFRYRGAEGIVKNLYEYFGSVVEDQDSETQAGFRLTLASLAADGVFAQLIYRRSQRVYLKGVQKAYAEAREDGDLTGTPIALANSTMFHEHVGTMMSAVLHMPRLNTPYASGGDELVRDAVRFCARGLGLSDESITRHLSDLPNRGSKATVSE
jgi:AcrR family transcriptional regulator